MKGFGLWAVIVLVLVLLLLSEAQGEEPCAPSIPNDLILVCHDGRVSAYSPSAREVLAWPVRCPTDPPPPQT